MIYETTLRFKYDLVEVYKLGYNLPSNFGPCRRLDRDFALPRGVMLLTLSLFGLNVQFDSYSYHESTVCQPSSADESLSINCQSRCRGWFKRLWTAGLETKILSCTLEYDCLCYLCRNFGFYYRNM